MTQWETQLPAQIPLSRKELDEAVESWTRCLIEVANSTIGMKTVWKGSKAWWSFKLRNQRKKVQNIKRKFRRKNQE